VLRRSKIDDDGLGDHPRLLVVNDDEAGCELVARILESRGFLATRVHAHNDALLALNKASEPVKGVLVDFTSGGASSSLKLLDSIRHGGEAKRDIPVIILAASANNRLFAFQSGVDAFVVRPVHADDLVAEIREVLKRSADEREAVREASLNETQSA
jgi:DNA-binding response OmpR family regulator